MKTVVGLSPQNSALSNNKVTPDQDAVPLREDIDFDLSDDDDEDFTRSGLPTDIKEIKGAQNALDTDEQDDLIQDELNF